MFRRIILIAISLFFISNMISYSQEPLEWEEIPIPTSYGRVMGIEEVNDSTYIISNTVDIRRTTDRGLNWEVVFFDHGITINSIEINGNGKLFAGTSKGLWDSSDEGQTWELTHSKWYDKPIDMLNYFNESLSIIKTGEEINDYGKLTHHGDIYKADGNFSNLSLITYVSDVDSYNSYMGSVKFKYSEETNYLYFFSTHYPLCYDWVHYHSFSRPTPIEGYSSYYWDGFPIGNKFYSIVILYPQFYPSVDNPFFIFSASSKGKIVDTVKPDILNTGGKLINTFISFNSNKDGVVIVNDWNHGPLVSYDTLKTLTLYDQNFNENIQELDTTDRYSRVNFSNRGVVYLQYFSDPPKAFRTKESTFIVRTPLNFELEQSRGNVKLNWKFNMTENNNYNVYRSESPDGEFELIRHNYDLTEISDYSVKPGKRYYYKVTSYREIIDKESEPTEVLSATMPDRIAAPDGLAFEEENDGLKISWNSVEGGTYYTLFKRTYEHVGYTRYADELQDTFFIDTKIDPWHKYSYQVKTYSQSRNETSDYSEPLEAWLTEEIPAPILTAELGHNAIELSWTGSELKDISYNIYRRELNGEFDLPIADEIESTQYSDPGLLDNTEYIYAVEAELSEFEAKSELSNEAAVLFTNLYEYADNEFEVQIVDGLILVKANKSISSISLYSYDGRELASITNSNKLTLPNGIRGLYFAVIEFGGKREILPIVVE